MKNILILYPSWESRSYGGFLRDLEKSAFTDCIIIRNETHHCEEALNQVDEINKKCTENHIRISYLDIDNNVTNNWRIIEGKISTVVDNEDKISLDITTMSRNIVWSLLYFLRAKVRNVDIFYHKPDAYNNDWISREPEQPRLLFKHSGIYDLAKKTTLVLVTGFDEDRTKHMLYKYEPQKVYLLVQEGEQFDNKQRNNEVVHRNVCEDFGLNKENIISKQIDSYSSDFGFDTMESVIQEENLSNIILASFGPKPSAVAAYRCYMEHPEIALCYLPCKDYNIDYCQGIGGSLYYILNFPDEVPQKE